MKRLLILATLIAALTTVPAPLAMAIEGEPELFFRGGLEEALIREGGVRAVEVEPELVLWEDCVVFGRIEGHRVVPANVRFTSDADMWHPPLIELGGFEIYSPHTGQTYTVELDEEGYFCLRADSGYYVLQRGDPAGSKHVFDAFIVPLGKVVNLGTYRVQTKSPKITDERDWQFWSEGDNLTSGRLVHVTADSCYDECEEWFSRCHKEIYDRYRSALYRR